MIPRHIISNKVWLSSHVLEKICPVLILGKPLSVAGVLAEVTNIVRASNDDVSTTAEKISTNINKFRFLCIKSIALT